MVVDIGIDTDLDTNTSEMIFSMRDAICVINSVMLNMYTTSALW